VPTCRPIIDGAPNVLDFLSEKSRAHFDAVLETLGALGVQPKVDTGLVRGLDYYTGTVFEIKSAAGSLGAQSTIVAGGRYDGLVEQLGGPATPAFGFALGVERALLCMGGDATAYATPIALFIGTMGAQARIRATALAHRIRAAGLPVEVEHRETGVKGQMRRAEKLGARFALVLGDAELASGKGKLKQMATRTEVEVALEDAAIVEAIAATR